MRVVDSFGICVEHMYKYRMTLCFARNPGLEPYNARLKDMIERPSQACSGKSRAESTCHGNTAA